MKILYNMGISMYLWGKSELFIHYGDNIISNIYITQHIIHNFNENKMLSIGLDYQLN